jgi:hypothetical protein
MRGLGDRILGASRGRRRRARELIGGKRRRRVLLGTLASTVALVAFLISNASAVHDLVFQLDGDTDADTQTHVPPGSTQTVDWDSIFNASGGDVSPLPANFGETSFKQDFSAPGGSFSTADSTTFTTGSKDTLDITPGWQCNRDNNVNSKIDIMNAYAVTYHDPVSSDDFLYFALERNANTGTADVGFWFLKGNATCTSPGGAVAFSGSHQDGDLLVVSEFTSGGHVSEIKVYRWNDDGPGGDPDGLGTTPIASGGDCQDNPDPPNADPPIPDDTCATVNTDTITDIPWLTANKQDGVGHSLRVSEFFEGGINLSNTGLAGACFNTFLADTRSSTSLTATLFDYASDRLGNCAATLATQVKTSPAPGTNVPPTPPINPGSPVHDTATVTGNKPVTPTGTVTFFMCSFAITSTDVCDGTTGKVGTSIGTGTLSGSGSVATANSPDVNTAASPLGPGRYCFRAEWPGDINYVGALKEFSGATECFSVKSVSSITTAQKWLPQDTATVLIDGVAATSGSVTFSLYEDTDTCAGTADATFTDTTVGTGGLFETNNSTYYTVTKVISWSAVYTPSDPNAVVPSTTTRCEGSTVTINNDTGPFPPPPAP